MSLRLGSMMKRSCKDFDWVCTKEEFDQWMEKESHKVNPTKVYELPEFNKWIVETDGDKTNCEFEIITPGHSSELLADLVYHDKESIETPFGHVPSLNLLFAIKDSHKFKKFHLDSSGFWKTTCDWHLMRSFGAEIKPEYEEFCKLRRAEAYAGQKHPKLNVSKDSFFKDDGLQDTYVWDHDSIHISAAPNGIPAYTLYLKDGESVLADKKKFFALPREIQLAGGIQEATVLAIERSKIIFGDTWNDRQAWIFSLAKVCSSITSGWFREFCFSNVFDIIKLYPENYWTKFQQDVAEGKVKPYTGSKY